MKISNNNLLHFYASKSTSILLSYNNSTDKLTYILPEHQSKINLTSFIAEEYVDDVRNHLKASKNNIESLNAQVKINGQLDNKECIISSQLINNEILVVVQLIETELKQEDNHNLLAEAAHDIRNPISTIMGCTNFINQAIKDSDFISKNEIDEMLNIIREQCNNAINFTSDLLEYSSVKTNGPILNIEDVEIVEFIKVYIETHRLRTINKQIKVTLNYSINSDTCMLAIDKIKFTRILDNLFSNAIKFSYQKSEIKFIIEEYDSNIIIKVQDSGIGIPDKVLKHIFTKFGKARRNGLNGEKSHGLGMSIVKQLVELHNGSINVKSKENIGTTVLIDMCK